MKHIAWPAGSNCVMILRPYFTSDATDDGTYPDRTSEWNAMFTTGTVLILEESDEEVGACDPSRDRYENAPRPTP